MEVTTGLLQGSPISPVLFAIYIYEIHGAVKSQVEGGWGISFVADTTWVVEGTDIDDAAASLCWSDNNFEARDL